VRTGRRTEGQDEVGGRFLRLPRTRPKMQLKIIRRLINQLYALANLLNEAREICPEVSITLRDTDRRAESCCGLGEQAIGSL
jgi:hypothetical protein